MQQSEAGDDPERSLRKACDRCRTRKLSCTGASATGSCRRCEVGNHECVFCASELTATRAPIGRPRKGDAAVRRIPSISSAQHTPEMQTPERKRACDFCPYSNKHARTDATDQSSSLSDLSLAVFLDSLQTVEIAPSDGLTDAMLQSPVLQLPNTMPPPSELPTRYAESIALRQDLAYTVPADMRCVTTD